MCSRIDYFSSDRADEYGNELKNQVEERLKFLASGVKPRKNIDVMKEVYNKIVNKKTEDETLLKKKTKKKKVKTVEDEEVNVQEEEQVEVEKPKKKKKAKVEA